MLAVVILLMAALGLALASACEAARPPEASHAVEDRWVLIWHDEFEGPAGSPVDPHKWTPQIGDGSAQNLPGWGNREWQYYTSEPENLTLDGQGHLAIKARQATDSH